MKQLHKAIGDPPHLSTSSDASKAIAHGVNVVYPWVEHRECFVHLMKIFSKKFQGPEFGRMYPAARTFQPEYHKYQMEKIYALSDQVRPFLEEHHNKNG
jgi:hypothetical protein